MSPLLAVAALLTPVHAQTSAVPGLISYQGKVSNAAGTAVGAGTPVNRLVIFRIWSHQSNSTINDLVYSEQQTVTISEGEFSVLIGQGAAVSGTPLGYSEGTKGPSSTSITSANVFAGATRFLGVTIDDGTGAADPEVSPRQQLVSSAYAMRAKYAESVGSNGANTLTTLDNGNVGIGTSNPGARLEVNGVVNVFDSSKGNAAGLATEVGAGMINFGINDNRFGGQTQALQGGFLRTNTQPVSNLFQFYARPAGSASPTEVMSITSTGNVGIGQFAPVARLDVGGNISLFDGGGRVRSAGLQTEANGSLINFGVNDSSSNRFGGSYTQADQGGFLRVDSRPYGLFQFMARPAGSTSASEVMTILANGNVGIGNAAPTAKLHVNGSISATSMSLSGAFQVPGATTTHTQGAWLEWNKFGNAGQTYLLNQRGLGSGGLIFGEVSTADVVTENMRITADGKVGIGTSTPAARLDVNGGVMLNSGINNAASRPAVGTARLSGEIGAYGSGGAYTDDGFLRLSAGGGTSTTAKSFIDVTGYSTVADMNANIRFGTAGTERMRIDLNGNVGIGTSAPSTKLDVNGIVGLHDGGSKSRNAGIQTEVNGQLINFGVNDSSANRFGGTYTPTDQGGFLRVDSRAFSLFSFHARAPGATSATEVVTITSSGRMGIGTSAPSVPLHVVGTGVQLAAFTREGRVQPNSTGDLAAENYNPAGNTDSDGGKLYQIVAEGRIKATALDSYIINTSSDARIKNVVGPTSGTKDLATLRQLVVTDYKFKDTVTHGAAPQKKLVAQQVESVFPQAVNRNTEVIPDLFCVAGIRDGWIELATDLKQGERVRLTGDSAGGVFEVLEVQPGRFRTEFATKGDTVFVYGREVRDFRVLDYDAIAILNVSATQELARQVETLKASEARNAELSRRVAELEAKDRARDAKLAAIEKLLSASSTVMAQPAKSAAANGQE